jgi:hypothetical protein
VSNVWLTIDLGATYAINSISILDGAGSNWARNNATEIVIGDNADPFAGPNQQCFGPAPITCYSYSIILPGNTAPYGADGWFNSNLCTSNAGPINIASCSGTGRYVFVRKHDKYAAAPNGMWVPGMNFFDQCKFSTTFATHPGCNVCQPEFAAAVARSGDPKPCGQCAAVAQTPCTTAPYAQWGGQNIADGQLLVIGEVTVYGNLQRFNPVGRTGAAAVAYGGRMVVFGGQDVNGLLLSDTQLFNTVTMQWEAPMLPLGTPPPARAFAAAALLPSGVAGVLLTDNTYAPSSSIAIFGGVGSASTYSDISTLSFTPCPRFGINPATGLFYAGIGTVSCSTGGTICSYTCTVPFTALNAFATCNGE